MRAHDRDRPQDAGRRAHDRPAGLLGRSRARTSPNVGGMFVILEPFEERSGEPELQRRRVVAELRQQVRARSRRPRSASSAPRRSTAWAAPAASSCRCRTAATPGPRRCRGRSTTSPRRATRNPGSSACSAASAPTSRSSIVDVDRDKAKTLGVSLDDVFDTLQAYLGSAYVNDFTRFGRNWQVNVQADAALPHARRRTSASSRSATRAGDMVPLATLIDRQATSTGPADRQPLQHVSRPPRSTAAPRPGTSSGQAIAHHGADRRAGAAARRWASSGPS